MTIHGTINHTFEYQGGSPFTGAGNVGYGSETHKAIIGIFVVLHSFLNSAFAQSVGIFRRAYSTGAGPGNGMNFWDQPDRVGVNAWALFEFTGTTPHFWMLIQQATHLGASFGNSPGNPGTLDGGQGPSANGVAASFALAMDGTSPWNGTTNNNGSDTKGDPVWKTPTAASSSPTAIFPRANDVGGDHNTHSQAMIPILREDSVSTFGDFGATRKVNFHCVTDGTSIALMAGDSPSDYFYYYFGRYVPRANFVGSVYNAPYVCLARFGDNSPQLEFEKDKYDFNTFGRQDNQYMFGPPTYTISRFNDGQSPPHYMPLEGGIVSPYTGHAIGVVPGYYPLNMSYCQPNRITRAFDLFDIPIYIDEYHQANGYVGDIQFIKYVYSLRAATTLGGRKWCVIGNRNRRSAMAIPWDGQTVPFGHNYRGGVQF